MIINIASKTDVGIVRDHNEDNFAIGLDPAKNDWSNIAVNYKIGDKGVLVVIADGMGGAEAGEIASEIAINTVKEEFGERVVSFPNTSFELLNLLKDIIHKAHENIILDIDKNPKREGMGTTILLSLIFNNHAYVAWVGDSRAYRYNKKGINSNRVFDLDNLEIVTNDHSVVWEYVLAGNMSSEEARLHTHSNIITQSLGNTKKPVNPDVAIVRLNKDDRLIFCSDGLNSMVSDKKISDIMDKDKPTEKTCDKLIEKALKEGGSDNVTVCVVDIIEMDKESIINDRSKNITESTLLMPKNPKRNKKNFLKYGKYLVALVLISAFSYVGSFMINRNYENDLVVKENNKIQNTSFKSTIYKKVENIETDVIKDSIILDNKRNSTTSTSTITTIRKKKNNIGQTNKTMIDELKKKTKDLNSRIHGIEKNLNNINFKSLDSIRQEGYKIIEIKISLLKSYILSYFNFKDDSFTIRYKEIKERNCIKNSEEKFKSLDSIYNNFIDDLKYSEINPNDHQKVIDKTNAKNYNGADTSKFNKNIEEKINKTETIDSTININIKKIEVKNESIQNDTT